MRLAWSCFVPLLWASGATALRVMTPRRVVQPRSMRSRLALAAMRVNETETGFGSSTLQRCAAASVSTLKSRNAAG